MNFSKENLGARRLHEIIEILLEEELFESKQDQLKTVCIDKSYVSKKLQNLNIPLDLKKYLI